MRIFILIIGVLLFSFSVNACAQEGSSTVVPGIVDIHPCHDQHIGIDLLCNRHWRQEIEPNTVLMIISDDPAVLLTVAKTKGPVTGIEELTEERIKVLGQYADGFKTEQVRIGNDQAVRVEGFAADYPEMRLLDFYVIHDYTLYSFLFSVNPKEEWGSYAVLLEKIAQSIKIPDKKN